MMHSSLIGKIEKAHRYAQERERITFSEFAVSFQGEHSTYNTGYKEGQWHCNCSFFPKWGLCSHTMALQKILSPMLPKEAFSAEVADKLGLPSH
jgi:hypothetical protein